MSHWLLQLLCLSVKCTYTYLDASVSLVSVCLCVFTSCPSHSDDEFCKEGNTVPILTLHTSMNAPIKKESESLLCVVVPETSY